MELASFTLLSVTFVNIFNGALRKQMDNKDLISIDKYFSEVGYYLRRVADKLRHLNEKKLNDILKMVRRSSKTTVI